MKRITAIGAWLASAARLLAACDDPNPGDAETLPFLIVQPAPTTTGAPVVSGSLVVDVQAGVPATLSCAYLTHAGIDAAGCATGDDDARLSVGEARIGIRSVGGSFQSIDQPASAEGCIALPPLGAGVLSIVANIDPQHPAGSVLEVELVARLETRVVGDASDDRDATQADAGDDGEADASSLAATAAPAGDTTSLCPGYVLLVQRSLLLADPVPTLDAGDAASTSTSDAADERDAGAADAEEGG